jgi:hypothetical protein
VSAQTESEPGASTLEAKISSIAGVTRTRIGARTMGVSIAVAAIAATTAIVFASKQRDTAQLAQTQALTLRAAAAQRPAPERIAPEPTATSETSTAKPAATAPPARTSAPTATAAPAAKFPPPKSPRARTRNDPFEDP